METQRGKRVGLVFRCYDDAVAIRYELPINAVTKQVVIANESTSFGVVGEPTAWVQYLENFKTSHEHEVTRVPWRDIRRGVLVDLPLTLFWTDDMSVALTEASLRNYTGMALMRPAAGASGNTLVAQLTPREHEVMRLVLAGKFNKVIADELNISMRTVEVHRSRVFEKMGVRSAVELAQLLAHPRD